MDWKSHQENAKALAEKGDYLAAAQSSEKALNHRYVEEFLYEDTEELIPLLLETIELYLKAEHKTSAKKVWECWQQYHFPEETIAKVEAMLKEFPNAG